MWPLWGQTMASMLGMCVFFFQSHWKNFTKSTKWEGDAAVFFIFHKNLDLFVDCLVLTRVINRTSRFQKTFFFV